MASTATALTVVDRVEQSPVVMQLDASSQALVDLLPDAAAAARFRRVVIQALVKNPELLECTPESVVVSVFEAAAQGLEPTGAAGGAHLVPFNVNVGTKQNPRWEKRAQLIPDYRGVIRLVTKEPSEVSALEARVVKEGDDFEYALGTDAFVRHVPKLDPGRSDRATTHVYAIARLKSGASIPDVMDRAEIERIQKRGRQRDFSPWATDWDEMAKKTMIKRIAKNLPVRPEVRTILMREDEPEPTAAPAVPAGPSRVARLAERLAPVATPEVQVEPTEPAEPEWIAAPDVDLAAAIRTATDESSLEGRPSAEQRASLKRVFTSIDGPTIQAGIRAIWGAETITEAAQAQAIVTVADSMDPDAFDTGWTSLAAAR